MSDEQNNEAEVKPAAAKKTRAPRKSTRKAEAPAGGEVGAPAAPAEKTAKKPAARKPRAPKQPKPEAAVPAPEAKPAQAPKAEGNAKPLNTSEERADATSEEKPLVRHMEQQQPKPMSVPGFATPETVGGNEGNGGNGRRRRNRHRNRNRGNEEGSRPQGGVPAQVNADELYRRAWKIYLAEVSEEGLAMMDDNTAREASRRAFRVAELFLTEASRHRPSAAAPAAESAPAAAQEPETEAPEAE